MSGAYLREEGVRGKVWVRLNSGYVTPAVFWIFRTAVGLKFTGVLHPFCFHVRDYLSLYLLGKVCVSA